MGFKCCGYGTAEGPDTNLILDASDKGEGAFEMVRFTGGIEAFPFPYSARMLAGCVREVWHGRKKAAGLRPAGQARAPVPTRFYSAASENP